MQFTKVAHTQGDLSFVEYWRREVAQLGKNLEQNGWDGGWYRRAYFDDSSRIAYNNH